MEQEVQAAAASINQQFRDEPERALVERPIGPINRKGVCRLP
jgi:hypothetical protein